MSVYEGIGRQGRTPAEAWIDMTALLVMSLCQPHSLCVAHWACPQPPKQLFMAVRPGVPVPKPTLCVSMIKDGTVLQVLFKCSTLKEQDSILQQSREEGLDENQFSRWLFIILWPWRICPFIHWIIDQIDSVCSTCIYIFNLLINFKVQYVHLKTFFSVTQYALYFVICNSHW